MPALDFPKKLYGREVETSAILSCLFSSQSASPHLITVSGPPGIGKTSVINQVQQSATRNGSLFISGKCDPLQRDLPYSVVIEAFTDLINQLLTEDDAQLVQWREKILTALGTNAQVIIDVIPEVELIIGAQPPVADLGPTESRNRFNLVFQNFIHVFCSQKHSLVIFFDDLQWADSATLKLFQLIATDDETERLFLIGAYRDNEVSSIHPLMLMLENLWDLGVKAHQLSLGPLSNRQVGLFLADTLQESPTRTKPLADLTFKKTAGNPLILQQLIQNLYEEKRLTHDPNSGTWHWHVTNLSKPDLAKFIADRFSQLLPQSQHILKRAACIGSQASISILMRISDMTEDTLFEQLQDAVDARLIRIDSEKIQFTHDCIQQTIYEQIQSNTRAAMHLTTGRLLQAANGNLFSITNHLNLGSIFLTSQEQNVELISLNLEAAQQARNCVAFESALPYIRKALELTSRWGLFPIEIYLNGSEVEYANGNFCRTKDLAKIVLKKTKAVADRAKAYELIIQAYTARNEMGEAIESSLFAMQEFGIDICENPPADLDIKSLFEMPKLTDSNSKYISYLRVLKATCTAAYATNTPLFLKIIFTMLNICSEYGNSSIAPYAYVVYGVICCGSGHIGLGVELGRLALRLLDSFEVKDYQAEVLNIFNGHILHWEKHLSSCQEPLKSGIETGLKTGATDHAGFAAINHCANAFMLGVNLKDCILMHKEKIGFLEKFNLGYHKLYAIIGQELSLYLIGENDCNADFDRDIFKSLLDSNHGPGLTYIYLAKTIIYYLLKDSPKNAAENAKNAEQYAPTATGLSIVATLNLYHSLSLLAHYPNTEPRKQAEALEKVTANQTQMRLWAHHAPMNFQHKFHLVEAELARIQGQNDVAIPLYVQAIEGARENGYIQEEALANELAGRFYLAIVQRELAEQHLFAAHAGYQAWGAHAVVARMEREHEFLRSPDLNTEFAKTIIKKLTNKIKPSTRKGITSLGIEFKYKSASQKIVLVTKGEHAKLLGEQLLPYLQPIKPTEKEIGLEEQ